uniref:Uncharacterized protein n=1 Tax=Arundo donax TaxID=35708 RepID=A0A0A9HJM6_ARUDO
MSFGHINQHIFSTENDQVSSPLATSSVLQFLTHTKLLIGVFLAVILRITNYHTFLITCFVQIHFTFWD